MLDYSGQGSWFLTWALVALVLACWSSYSLAAVAPLVVLVPTAILILELSYMPLQARDSCLLCGNELTKEVKIYKYHD